MHKIRGGHGGEGARLDVVDIRPVGCHRFQAENNGDRMPNVLKSPMALSIRSFAFLDVT